MSTGRLSLLFHTVRHLRVEQVAYRVYYRLGRRLVPRRALATLPEITTRPWLRSWQAPLVAPRSHFGNGAFVFLGEPGEIRLPTDWNVPSKSKLWLYNLHYLDDLNAVDADARAEEQDWLIERWVADNPPLAGNGWEPYPISLRLINLIKWCARQSHSPEQWLLASMARQTQALAVQEERHILANHLFANGKALTFAGAFFAGDHGARWLRSGLDVLDREIDEQFLADGGHFELSPMYHATLLWDLCDLLNLAQICGLPELAQRAPAWRGVIEDGLVWLEAMCHPDGDISFFNDAAHGVAPHPDEIRAYAVALGCRPAAALAGGLAWSHLTATGYIVVQMAAGARALLDVAEVGPSYQPGHAHADTLSFELSLFGQRVLVNSGTSRYGEDDERHRQRSTAAHNTVEIDGESSSEVWSGFRVARRARPTVPVVRRDDSGLGPRLLVRCAHDGYRRLPGAPVHQREWVFEPGRLRVTDRLSGTYRKAVGRFHLHPDIRVTSDRELLLGGGHKVRWNVAGGQARVVPASWHPQFGASAPTSCIEVLFGGSEVTVDFIWE